RVGFVDEVALFPVLRLERFNGFPGGVNSDTAFDNGPLLAINTALVRISSANPSQVRGATWFIGAGLSAAIATPRTGHRIVPAFAAGVRTRLTERLGFEASVHCNAPQLGKTICSVPLAVALPLRR